MDAEAMPIDVVAGLIEDGHGRLLACRRPPGKHLAGKWEFPGGKIEPGETPAAALVRELREELGITIDPLHALTPVTHDYGRAAIRLIPLVCRIVEGLPHPHEHDRIEWCDAAALAALDLAEADLPILAEWLEARGGSA